MTKREMERLLDLLAKLSEEEGIDGAMRDEIGRIRDYLWDRT